MIVKHHFLIKTILNDYYLNDLHLQIHQYFYKNKLMNIILFWLGYFNQLVTDLDLNNQIVNPILCLPSTTPELYLQYLNYYIYFCISLKYLKIKKHEQIEFLNKLLSTLLIIDNQLIIQSKDIGLFSRIIYWLPSENYLLIKFNYQTKNYQLNKQYAKKWVHYHKKFQYGYIKETKKRYHDSKYVYRKMVQLIKNDIDFNPFYMSEYREQHHLNLEPFLFNDVYYYNNNSKCYYT